LNQNLSKNQKLTPKTILTQTMETPILQTMILITMGHQMAQITMITLMIHQQ